MREWIIWGARGHAAVVVDLLREHHQAAVVACFDNDPSAPTSVLDVPRIGGRQHFMRWVQTWDKPICGAVAIGGDRGRERREVASYMGSCGVSMPVVIHPTASICASAVIGGATQVLALAHVGSRTTVGESCIINTSSVVEHDVVMEDGVHVAPRAVLCGEVYVGRDALLGAGCTVLPRRQIGEGAIIGAGAVVTRDVAPGETVLGNPARSS